MAAFTERTEGGATPAAAPVRAPRVGAFPRWRQGLARAWLVLGLLVCALLLGRTLPGFSGQHRPRQVGTPTQAKDQRGKEYRAKPIKELRVGDRIRTIDPDHPTPTDDDPLLGGPTTRRIDRSDITREGWRCLELQIDQPGSTIRVRMLRPLWWLEEVGVREGGTIELHLLELEIKATAQVLRIGPCEVDSRDNGPGEQIVTATLVQDNAEVWDLTFEGKESALLVVTARHPLYSQDRHAWVAAGELQVGEHVTAVGGNGRLASKVRRPGRHTVYNLEVHRTHAYYVSSLGLLAHNNPPSGGATPANGGSAPAGPPGGKWSRPIQPGSEPGKWVVDGREYPNFQAAMAAARGEGGPGIPPAGTGDVPTTPPSSIPPTNGGPGSAVAQAPEPTVTLEHGTTMQRAQNLMTKPPDLNFREKGAPPGNKAEGFSTSIPGLRAEAYGTGDARSAALSKARIPEFQDEGGPAILRMEVPVSIARRGERITQGEVRFTERFGIKELQERWSSIVKTIIQLLSSEKK
jgi:hypothetical protein